MTVVLALAVAILFGTGAHLMVRPDAFKLAAGTVLITNAAVLLLVAGGFGTQAPLAPIADPATVADPLVQALAVTAIVISFGTTVFLLRVAVAVERSHDTIDFEELVEAEVEEGGEPMSQKRTDAREGRSR